MKYPTINGEIVDFVTDDEALKEFGIFHGEKLTSPRGEATIIGIIENSIEKKLWAHYDDKIGAEQLPCFCYEELIGRNFRRMRKITEIANPTYFQIRDKFPDVELEVDGEKFQVHRCVLALFSKYFETMFSTDIGTINQIDGISKEIFGQIVNFCYTNVIIVDETNFMELIHASEMLMIKTLKQKCIEYLNVLDVREFLGCFEELKLIAEQECINYIKLNWILLIDEEKFYEVLNENISFQKILFKNLSVTSSSSIISEMDRNRILEYFQMMSKKCPTILDQTVEKADDVRNICDKNGIPIPLWYKERYERFFKHE